MANPARYVPILKTKAGEMDALSKIAPGIRKSLTPLLEVTPVPPKWPDGEGEPAPAKSIDAHVECIADSISTSWGAGFPIFIDGRYIEDDDVLSNGSEPIYGVLARVRSSRVLAVPVIGTDRLLEYVEACKQFAGESNSDLCIRLTGHDLEDLGKLDAQIEEILEYLGRPPEETHLIIDYEFIAPALSGALKAALPFQIAAVPMLTKWKTVTFAASSFPADLREVGPYSLDTFARTEWEVWQQMRGMGRRIKRVPDFGDYTVTHPELTFVDPRKMRMSPKIKYCDRLQWIVARGEAYRRKKDPKPSVPGKVQYPKLAKMIMEHPAWCGSYFSWGDEFIEACAGEENSGNPQQWVTVGTVHHIVFVVQQLASLHAI